MIGQAPLSLPQMYRSRSVTRTVSSSRLFHSSPLRLNVVRPKPTSAEPVEPSGENGDARQDGQPTLSKRFRQAASSFQGCITKAAGDTAVNVRKRADGFTVVTQALFSELGGQLNRATGYEDIELLKKKVEQQGMYSPTQPFALMALHVNLPSQNFVLTRI